jgi:hypothetical protein
MLVHYDSLDHGLIKKNYKVFFQKWGGSQDEWGSYRGLITKKSKDFFAKVGQLGWGGLDHAFLKVLTYDDGKNRCFSRE